MELEKRRAPRLHRGREVVIFSSLLAVIFGLAIGGVAAEDREKVGTDLLAQTLVGKTPAGNILRFYREAVELSSPESFLDEDRARTRRRFGNFEPEGRPGLETYVAMARETQALVGSGAISKLPRFLEYVFAREESFLVSAGREHQIDVVFIVDCTNSMAPILAQTRVALSEALEDSVQKHRTTHTKIRAGFTTFDDRDRPVWQLVDLTADTEKLRRNSARVAIGESDRRQEEKVYDAILKTSELVHWAPQTPENRRLLIPISDEAPRPELSDGPDGLPRVLDLAKTQSTSIYPFIALEPENP